MTKASSILIIDSHPLFREGLKSLIEPHTDLAIAGEAESVEEVEAMSWRLPPDAICLDLSLAGAPGYGLIANLLGLFPDVPILAVAQSPRSVTAVQAFRAGALGYVLKTSRPSTFLEAVRSVLRGNFFVDAKVASEVIHMLVSPDKGDGRGNLRHEELTGRETEIMRLIAQGVSTANIGKRLSISPRTVESHRANLMRKLGAANMVDIVRHAVRLELVDTREWGL